MSQNRMFRISTPHEQFFRAGRRWTREGTVIAESDLSEAEWTAVRAEPNLRIEEVVEGGAPTAPDADAIRAAIARLAPEDFTQSGVPSVEAVRRELADGGRGVTAADVRAVWTALKTAEG